MRMLTHTSPLPTLRREFDPPIDFSETDDTFVARMDLPGMKRDDIHVDLEDRRLAISGERKHEVEEKGENFHRMERSYGSFFRGITLPGEVKAGEIKATFHDGVLTVRIPKTEASKPRRIAVTTNGH